jgi:hypothetical protein
MADALVLVLSTPSVPEGEIARSRLEDEGIPVMVKGLDSPYRMGPVHLFVPAAFEVQARLVLETTGTAPADGTVEDARLETAETDDAEPEERA